MHRFDVGVGLADAPEGATLATAIGFYGTAIAPAGMSNVLWDGRRGQGGPAPGDQTGNGEPEPPDEPPDEPPAEGEQ